jgi:hypothetical protein
MGFLGEDGSETEIDQVVPGCAPDAASTRRFAINPGFCAVSVVGGQSPDPSNMTDHDVNGVTGGGTR